MPARKGDWLPTRVPFPASWHTLVSHRPTTERRKTVLIEVPGREALRIDRLVVDVNGTIAVDGVVIPTAASALRDLSSRLRVVALTADTHGKATEMRAELGIDVHVIAAGHEEQQKWEFVESLGSANVAAIGNGSNDARMLRAAALGICVIGPEGAASACVLAADVVVGNIDDALGLLAHPRRLVATLRR